MLRSVMATRESNHHIDILKQWISDISKWIFLNDRHIYEGGDEKKVEGGQKFVQ